MPQPLSDVDTKILIGLRPATFGWLVDFVNRHLASRHGPLVGDASKLREIREELEDAQEENHGAEDNSRRSGD